MPRQKVDPSEIELEPVISSNISAVGHDEDSQTLVVEFLSGDVWSYSGVSRDTFLSLRDAASVGGFFARNIKNQYPARRV